jgi:zinc transport system ATP-binding protein
MKENPLITISQVNFTYDAEPVLADINLQVKRGEFLGIIGPNGSGKSTLLKIILGLLKPNSGTVELFGTDIKSFQDWSKIGYVPQKAGSTYAHFPITVEEVVSLGLTNNDRLIDFIQSEDRQRITETLAAVQMENHRKKLLNELSGGQQQRVFIAQALISQPELLVLDEPTVGVDSDSQARFYELLQDLNRKLNLTLILVSHDIEVVAHEVTRIACINRTIISHGHPQEMLAGNFIEKLYGKDLRFIIHKH